jgi:4-amino-4-deoxy-L-arabinose transferase-like glycosyltransferase
MLMFLSKHQIQHLGDLDSVIKSMVSDRSVLMENLKPVERRLDTLKEHLYWVEVHKTNSSVHRTYQKQPPMKRDAFYEKNRPALTLYESSKKYLDSIMNGNKTLPIGAWEREQKELLQEKQQLTTQYNHLKNEVVQVEQIRRQVERILEQHSPKTHKHQIDNPEL